MPPFSARVPFCRPRRHPALPRRPARPRRRGSRRAEGRHRHGAEGGEGVLSGDRRGVGHRAGAGRDDFVRPERQGLKVIEILADAGDTVTAGQTLARLLLPEGGTLVVQAPVAGLIGSSTAVIGAIASGARRGAVLDHRPQRVRPDRHRADPRHRQTAGQPDRADQGDRRARGRRQGDAGGADHPARQPARPGHAGGDRRPSACW